MPQTSVVLTLLADDRPGLVDTIAQTVTEHGGNWIESRMARLAGQFAGILRVEVDAAQADALTNSLSSLGGLNATVHADASTPVTEKQTICLSLVGQDRPGIIREISRVLATHGVNVEELTTECQSAAHTGQTLFQATAQLQLPEKLSTEALSAALEQVASDLMVDVTLQ